MKRFTFILLFALTFVFSAQAFAATRDEQRGEIQRMQSHVLSKLYELHPGAEKRISKAVGYAVFSSADVAIGFFSGSYGHGVAHDNQTGQETYMQMAAAGVGLGLGVKDFRVVFVFSDKKSFRDFVDTGLDLSGHADLAAKQGAKGGAVGRIRQETQTALLPPFLWVKGL